MMGALSGRAKASPTCNGSGTPFEIAEEFRRIGNVIGNEFSNTGKGSLAAACENYEMALQTLNEVEPTEGADEVSASKLKESVSQLRLMLHLNLALTHLRRAGIFGSDADNVLMPAFIKPWKESLTSAVEHSASALAIDPHNEKGFLRRGNARSGLSGLDGHGDLAELAAADFQKVLELNPESADAQRQLKIIAANKERTECNRDLESIFRPEGASRRPVLSVEGVHYQNEQQELLLGGSGAGIYLDLNAGRCLGILADDAVRMSSLARLFSEELSPSIGKVSHHGKLTPPPGTPVSTAAMVLVSIACAIIYTSAFIGKDAFSLVAGIDESITWVHGVVTACIALPVMIAFRVAAERNKSSHNRHSVIHMTGEALRSQDHGHTKTIEEVIAEKFSLRVPLHQRRSRAMAMLQAAGLKKDDSDQENTRFESLAAEQKQLVNLLRCLASCPDVLICDAVLQGLDNEHRARALHMLKRMKDEIGISILYAGEPSSDVAEIQLIADSIGVLCGGCLVELGPAVEVIDDPKSSMTKAYISGCKVPDGKLAKQFADLTNDPGLVQEWLPH